VQYFVYEPNQWHYRESRMRLSRGGKEIFVLERRKGLSRNLANVLVKYTLDGIEDETSHSYDNEGNHSSNRWTHFEQ
jgi:hypothetical protein